MGCRQEGSKAISCSLTTQALLTDTVELCQHLSIVALLGFSVQLLGGVSKGMALMTMDQEYINRFRIRNVTLRQRLLQGVQAAGIGFYEGFIGMP